ncbi:hypothetical protein CEXT_465771 [Caerostris extrusa]|uniref:Uncharacterized protein n=1 Tax=Caerostris extrusa TaxID=172846 RepID=A0AAV4PSN7_CAEEX|nr:hypothetical protein CEXT_465771 [Caerostris extrusa]
MESFRIQSESRVSPQIDFSSFLWVSPHSITGTSPRPTASARTRKRAVSALIIGFLASPRRLIVGKMAAPNLIICPVGTPVIKLTEKTTEETPLGIFHPERETMLLLFFILLMYFFFLRRFINSPDGRNQKKPPMKCLVIEKVPRMCV